MKHLRRGGSGGRWDCCPQGHLQVDPPLETPPRDPTQRPHPETPPRDTFRWTPPQRPHPETPPRDPTQRPHPETPSGGLLPRDPTQRHLQVGPHPNPSVQQFSTQVMMEKPVEKNDQEIRLRHDLVTPRLALMCEGQQCPPVVQCYLLLVPTAGAYCWCLLLVPTDK
ncbi:unnamed protein product [Arctogadus glacialis]